VLASKLLEHDNNLHVTSKANSSVTTKMAPALFREQIAESKSSEVRLEHEIPVLKSEMERLVQEKEELAALFHEQSAASKSSEARLEHEILALKTAMEQLVQEKDKLVAFFHEQFSELKANVAKLEEDNLPLTASKVEQQVPRHDNNPQTESLSSFIASIHRAKLASSSAKLHSESSPGGSPTTMLPKTAPVYVWKSSATSIATGRTSDHMIDVLNFPGVPPGTTCTWNIKILRAGEGLRLGVVTATSHSLLKMNLGESSYSWGYGGGGDAWYERCRVGGWHVGFGTGSVVTFRLEGGSMSVSVDGKPMVQVFQGMRPGCFVPAVFLFNGCSVEFLGHQGL
jgi:SPRY domain